MIRSFSNLLLITSIFVQLYSCKTTYVHTGANPQNLSVTNENVPLDSQVVRLYLPYKTILEKDMGRVISFAETEMIKNKPESGLTNLLSDLLLEEGKMVSAKDNLNFNPVISFFNYGGIRTSLPEGEITVGKIYEIMPFENEMVFVLLTGEQLQQFFDIVAKHGGESVAGARFVISNGKAKNVSVDGKKLDLTEKYWMVTNDYVAGGGDDMQVLAQSLQMINSGLKIRDVMISYFEKKYRNGEKLTVKLDGRISNE